MGWKRKPDENGRAATWWRAGLDRPAMTGDNLRCDVEPEASAGGGCRGLGAAIRDFEDSAADVRRNADPVISYHDHRFVRIDAY